MPDTTAHASRQSTITKWYRLSNPSLKAFLVVTIDEVAAITKGGADDILWAIEEHGYCEVGDWMVQPSE